MIFNPGSDNRSASGSGRPRCRHFSCGPRGVSPNEGPRSDAGLLLRRGELRLAHESGDVIGSAVARGLGRRTKTLGLVAHPRAWALDRRRVGCAAILRLDLAGPRRWFAGASQSWSACVGRQRIACGYRTAMASDEGNLTLRSSDQGGRRRQLTEAAVRPATRPIASASAMWKPPSLHQL